MGKARILTHFFLRLDNVSCCLVFPGDEQKICPAYISTKGKLKYRFLPT